MSDACNRYLTDFFTNYLPFTPTSRDVEMLKRDLQLVSPFIMRAALKEVKATQPALRCRPISDWREAIFRVYNRKVAEHAQLFPVFHSFETAFRSTVAVDLEDFYKQNDWWTPVKNDLVATDAPRSQIHIHGRQISSDITFLITKIITDIELKSKIDVRALADGYEFLEYCSLNHVKDLILNHWHIFGGRFRRGKLLMSQKDFSARFYRVINARNEIYHHKSVAGLKHVVSTAEELLDNLNYSLGFATHKIASSTPKALTFNISVGKRHNTW
jgi:hypothetical protein